MIFLKERSLLRVGDCPKGTAKQSPANFFALLPVRVGLARPVENKESRTFIARMGQYPELVSQLHSAAVDQGLSIYTLVFGVADGGNGLKEALEAQFSHFQFILDYAHLKQHLYQAVEAMELEPKWRSIWLNCAIDLIEGGRVKTIISRLKHWSGQGKEVVFNFAKYKEAVSSICAL